MVNEFVSCIQFVQIYLLLVMKDLGSLRLQLQLRQTSNKKMATVFGTFVLNTNKFVQIALQFSRTQAEF